MIRYALVDYFRRTNAFKAYPSYAKHLNWTRDQLSQYQTNMMRDYLVFAYETTPYYKSLFDQHRFNPYLFSTENANMMLDIPTVDKTIVKDRYQDFISTHSKQYDPMAKRTSGTTGQPFEYILSRSARTHFWVDTYRQWHIGGWQFGQPMGVFRGSAITALSEYKAQLYRALNNWHFFDTFLGTSDQAMQSAIDTIRAKNIQFLYGYTASILNLARFVNETSVSIKLRSVFTTTEVLHDSWRTEIETAFQCQVFDFAQVCDSGFCMYQCNHGHYHTSDDLFYMLPNGKPGELAPVVSTNFHNRCMPLINYVNGDLYEAAALNELNCDCRAPFTVIKRLAGRVYEYFHLPDGTKVHGLHFGDTVREFPYVDYYQIHQVTPNQFVILLTTRPKHHDISDLIDAIRRTIVSRYPGTEFSIGHVDAPYSSKNGKSLTYVPYERFEADPNIKPWVDQQSLVSIL